MSRHLYVHYPFCASRCGYCDFYSQTDALGLAAAYTEALKVELAAECAAARIGMCSGAVEGIEVFCGGFDTVYLGGGTPTLLGAELLGDFLGSLQGVLRPGAEVTVEANPSTVSAELAEGLVAAGVNRVSLGVQSFSPELRRRLGRVGPVEDVEGAAGRLRAAGIDNLSLDLMFSLPGQTPADLDRDLGLALGLEPEHISAYELTVKEGSGFQRRWKSELDAAASAGRGFYEAVVDTLTEAGFRWYETSNFARPGRECSHNLGYWRGADFIGLGAGAWSTAGARRWRNVEDVQAYIAAAGEASGQKAGGFAGIRAYEELDTRQRLAELMLLGLRRDIGVIRSDVAAAIDEEQENILLRNGFLVNEGGRISLTRAGRFVANEVCARLLRD